MHVGFALLTLFPGRVGGSETNVRGLLGEFAAGNGPERVTVLANRHVMAAYEPGRAGGAARGALLPPGRRRGHALARDGLRARAPGPGRARRARTGLDLAALPGHGADPPHRLPAVVTLLDVQHHDLPGVLLTRRRPRSAGAPTTVPRATRTSWSRSASSPRAGSWRRWASRPSAWRSCTSASTTAASRPTARPPRARPARALPALSREPLAAQEPRAPDRGARAGARAWSWC